MTISVIIPTYNGAHKISTILKSIEAQTCVPDEVIVVIDGSTDNTEELLQKQIFGIKNFKVIVQQNGGRAKVRNTGAKIATGDLLIFFDDDMRLLADCIEQHKFFHERNSGGIVTGGLKEEALIDSPEIIKFKSFLSEKWNQPLIKSEGKPMGENEAFIAAANFSLSAVTFLALDGFDERLTDAEDHDMAIRAVNAGIPLYFHYKAFAWHDDLITCRTYIRRMRQYAVAQQMLSLLRPEYKMKYIAKLPSGLKGKVFRLFCSDFWIDSIDRNSWKILPREIRYKLYDIVITANGTYYPQIVPIK